MHGAQDIVQSPRRRRAKHFRESQQSEIQLVYEMPSTAKALHHRLTSVRVCWGDDSLQPKACHLQGPLKTGHTGSLQNRTTVKALDIDVDGSPYRLCRHEQMPRAKRRNIKLSHWESSDGLYETSYLRAAGIAVGIPRA